MEATVVTSFTETVVDEVRALQGPRAAMRPMAGFVPPPASPPRARR